MSTFTIGTLREVVEQLKQYVRESDATELQKATILAMLIVLEENYE